MIIEPKVTLWASTHLTEELFHTLPPDTGEDTMFVEAEGDLLAEAAGRSCYQSFSRPNEATNTTEKYIKHILEIGHESVLAHASATLYIEGVSRSLTHELVRSRFLAFSQVSQRYVDSSQMDWVCPPLALDDVEYQQIHNSLFPITVEMYEKDVARFMETRTDIMNGTYRRKRAREAARGVLPNYTETKIVTSGNMRAWRDFLKQRINWAADLEMQRLARAILPIVSEIAPATFSDIENYA